MNLETWEALAELKPNFVRVLSTSGEVQDVRRVRLDGVLEDYPVHGVYHSMEEWQHFLKEQKFIEAQWALRHTRTGEDTKLLREMGMCWNTPDPKMRAVIEDENNWQMHLWSIWWAAVIREHGIAQDQIRLWEMKEESRREMARRFAEERMVLARRIAAHNPPGIYNR